MRILFVHSGSDLYGASRSLARLASRLTKDGHSVLIVLPGEGPLKPLLEQSGMSVTIHPCLPLLTRKTFGGIRGILSIAARMPGAVYRLCRLIRTFQPDLMHTNTATVFLVSGLAARACRVPHIWHIREFFTEFGRVWNVYRRMIDFLSDRIICVSEAVASQFTERGRRKTRVVHNGMPAVEFDAVEGLRVEQFKHRHGLGNGLAAGVVGRIKLKRKGQETFVEAAAQLKETFSKANYLIVGSPFPGNESHEKALRQKVAELGMTDQVVFTGDVQDIKAAISALDVVVLSSGQPEPFGGAVVEAMALRRPVIGTCIGGTVEQIEDGVTGFLVEPNNPADMARAMERLFKDPALRQRMGQAGRDRFLRLFEFEGFYTKVMSLYQSLAVLKP